MGAVAAIPAERIISSILWLRSQKVLLGRDLAGLYGVERRVLVQAVQRNLERFPEDFMFGLTKTRSGKPSASSSPHHRARTVPWASQ